MWLYFSMSWLQPCSWHKGFNVSNWMYPWLENFIFCCFVCIMVFHSRSSGATHTLHFFLTLSVLLPLPSLTNALTPTQRCTQVFTNHLQQICWSLCTQIKLMASCVRSQRTEWSSYHCSSLQYPAPKPDERSMIYQSVSVVLAWGWFTNTKHTARRTPPPPSVVWWCSMALIMQSQLLYSLPYAAKRCMHVLYYV